MDSGIVGEKGEERLRDIDTTASKIFRELGISWRYFPLTKDAKRQEIGALDSQLITIPDCHTEVLRLFFLSLLWRSAVSTRFEFAEIILDKDSIEALRRVVLGIDQPNAADFPCVLVLLTNAGEPQVHAPMAQTIDMKGMGFDLPNVPIFRFFLDGLIVHMGRKRNDLELLDTWGKRVVGVSRELFLIGRPYEGSSQQINLQILQEELHADYPSEAERIYRTLAKIGSTST
jgi:hypothetical protein